MGTLLDPAPTSMEENMVIKAEPRHELFSNNYFERLSEFLTLTADKNEFGNQSIILRPPQEVFTNEHLHREVEVAINEIMHGMLENKTLFFDGQKNNTEFIVILANASPEEAKEISIQLMQSLKVRLSNKIDISEFSVAIKSTGERSDLGTATNQ